MSERDDLHLAAARYANDRRSASDAYRKKMGQRPLDKDGSIWVAHYEGFRDGMTANQKEKG